MPAFVPSNLIFPVMNRNTKNPDSSIKYVKTIGEKRAQALSSAGVNSVGDLLRYYPRRYLDRTTVTPICKLRIGEDATVIGRVENMGIVKSRKNWNSRFRLILADETGALSCVWFKGVRFLEKAFKVGETLAVFGKVTFFEGFQITHPEIDRLSDEEDGNFVHTGRIIPLYPSSQTLREFHFDSRGFRRLMKPVLDEFLGSMDETLPPYVLRERGLIPLQEALRQIHFPDDEKRLAAAQRRLKFEELFYLQLMLAYRKMTFGIEKHGVVFEKVGPLTSALIESLPFELTDAQKKVIREIRKDMKSGRPMNRLVQGDVGSGKTVVALICMMIALDNGYQATIMAPTEILAEQHYLTISEYLFGQNVKVGLITGSQTKKDRDRILESIRSCETDLVVGTHAVFQKMVEFGKLGFVVIDEQHRFGVLQRAELIKKGRSRDLQPDVLVMTATPIPRTLALTVYGDLDVSVIDRLPSGRKKIVTRSASEKAIGGVYDFVRGEIAKGRQIYIVYPLIDETEKSDLKAAIVGFEKLSKKVFSDLAVGLLHGKMKSDEKEQAIRSFKKGELDILVSTTVVEVGVDVPNATVMVIEHAERFGLTQLHQLRGRVGRGAEQAFCILVKGKKLTDEAVERIRVMEATTDGFKIAEEDLRIRGPGDFFGTRQSGLPDLKIANILFDYEILREARRAAFNLVRLDPQLRAPENKAVRKNFIDKYKNRFSLVNIG